MIVKNEEEDLPTCLSSIKDIADEIIVVDTGSNDSTIEIAKKFGAKVFETEWKDDFSLARNFSLTKATGDWILWMDADNYIEKNSIDKINSIKNITPDHIIALKEINKTHGDVGGQELMQLRVFPRRDDIYFSNKIHEQISESVNKAQLEIKFMDASIIHRGYENPIKREQKNRRNIAIMEKEINSGNNNIYLIFKYAGHLQDLGENQKAVENYNKIIDNVVKEDVYINYSQIKIAEIFMNTNKIREAIPILEKNIEQYGENITNTCYYGVALYFTGETDNAIKYLEKSISFDSTDMSFEAIDNTLIKTNAFKYLGEIYNQRKDNINLRRILEKIRKIK